MSTNFTEKNIEQLSKEYRSIMDYTMSLTPSTRVKNLIADDDEYRQMTFSLSDIAQVLNLDAKVNANQMRKLVEQYEAQSGNTILFNNSNHKHFTHEDAEDFLSYCDVDSIRLKRDKGHQFKVPVVYNTQGKGGVGKTTGAVHLGVEAAMDPSRLPRVLIIDRDASQGSVGHLYSSVDDDFEFSSTLPLFQKYAYLSREERLSPEVQSELREVLINEYVLGSYVENLSFIPASREDIGIEALISELLAEGTSKKESYDLAYTIFSDLIIKPLENDFDLVIIDSSPSISNEKYALLYAANQLILPTTPRTLDLKSAADYRSVIANFVERLAPSDFNGWENIVTFITKCPSNLKDRADDVLECCHSVNIVVQETKAFEVSSGLKRPVQFLKATHFTGILKQRREINRLYNRLADKIFKNVWETE